MSSLALDSWGRYSTLTMPLTFFESVDSEEPGAAAPPMYHDLHDFSGFFHSHSHSQLPAFTREDDDGGGGGSGSGSMDCTDCTDDPTSTNANHKATPQSQSDDGSFTKSVNQIEQKQQQPLPLYDQSHFLLNLSLGLSRRLQQCLVISNKIAPPSLASLGATSPALAPANIDMDMDMDMDMEDLRHEGWGAQKSSDVFGDALNDTSEFLVIIQSYAASSCGNSTPQINIIVILNLLSAYLQIVAIFEILFRCLCKQLFDESVKFSFTSPSEKGDKTCRGLASNNNDYSLHAAAANSNNNKQGVQESNGLQTLPGLRLAGFSVQQGNLQTKILLHAVLHQFEMMERTLGLTTELRVTDQREGGGGDVGMSGALGISLADWMISKGARHIVVTTRNPGIAPKWIASHKRKGATVIVLPW